MKQVSDYGFIELSNELIEAISDNRMLKDEAERMQDLGTIEVEVDLCKVLRKGRFENDDEQAEDIGVVSEKALKGQAISHSVK